MKRAALGLCLCAATLSAGAADLFAIAPDLWDRPRSARAVLDQPAVRQALEPLKIEVIK